MTESVFLIFSHWHPLPRSPGAAPRAFSTPVIQGELLVVKDGVQAAGKKRESLSAGQLVAALDTSMDSEWCVQILSGVAAGQEFNISRQNVERYSGEYRNQLFTLYCNNIILSAPVSHQLLSETHSQGRELGRSAH